MSLMYCRAAHAQIVVATVIGPPTTKETLTVRPLYKGVAREVANQSRAAKNESGRRGTRRYAPIPASNSVHQRRRTTTGAAWVPLRSRVAPPHCARPQTLSFASGLL